MASPIVDTTFTSGTTITSNWLNGVNDAINDATQDITGATPRTLPAKLADTVSVKDFGAVGDGVTDDTAAIQAAVDSFNENWGTILFPSGTYKVTASISCFSGQNFIGDNVTINAINLDAPLFSYNVADISFNFSNKYSYSTINGFQVTGAGSGFAPGNANFVLVRANKTPFVVIKNCTCYRAAIAEFIGEAIFCSIDNVIAYNPISNVVRMTLGTGAFGPNYLNITNCEFEEQKWPCSGVYIEAGFVKIDRCLFESITKGIHLNGSGCGAVITNTGLPQRTQEDGISIHVESAYSLEVSECSCTFGGRYPSSIPVDSAFIRVDSTLSYFNVSDCKFAISHDNLDSSRIFDIRAYLPALITNNIVKRTTAGTNSSVFSLGDDASYQLAGIFSGNLVESIVGGSINFVENQSVAGTINATISENRFLRVILFTNNAGNIINDNVFYGTASAINFVATDKGILRGNTFKSSGWTASNYKFLEDNAGLFGTSDNEAPQFQATVVSFTGLAAGAFRNLTVPVPIPYSDSSYTVVATVFNATFGASTVTVDHICSVTGSNAVVVIKNNSASTQDGSLHIMFAHS